MAQNIGEAQIGLSVDTSKMEREVSAALKRLESKGFNLGGGVNAKSFTQPLGRITGAVNEFQKSLDASNARVIAFGASAGAIYNVQRAFTALISSTIEVQKSLTDINVILNANQKNLGQFGDQLFQIARNTGQAFSTVATAAGELARQGLSLEQTLKRTSDALILSRLSGLDAASSVEALTASVNSFNQSALNSTQIVNKLASVDAAFAVSSADLAEALKRVGSSAQDVGVSFDELLAIVASVNQTTARGGAVIGNSLKTIFTRIQRTDVLDQLEALGIAVRDLEGNTAPAIQILSGLARQFDQLGDAQRSQIAELVGGVFQINVLKAALGDLGREYSIYGNALKISTGATNEAIRRNEELNKTLAALLNRTVANLTKVGSEIGALTLAPAIEKVLGTINFALEKFDVKGDGIGSKIGKGILDGIGSFIAGPGLAILLAVFTKIFINLSKFVVDAAKVTLGLNKSSQEQAQIQQRINSILSQNPQLIQNILNKQVSLLQVEKDMLTIIQAQAKARQQTAAFSSAIAQGLMGRGVTVAKTGEITTKRYKSQGFIPNFNANKEIMGAISGGYMPGQVRSMNIPNYGRVTYNDAETVKNFPGLSQPGIMPPKSSDAGQAYKKKFKNKYGIDPYANQGFIPNFAARPITKAETSAMISKGYIKIPGGELKDFAATGTGKTNSIKNQYGLVQKGNEYFIPEGKYNKFVLASKARLEQNAKGGAGRYYNYALIYPGFKETTPFMTSGKPDKVGKDISFDAVPFPGQLKGKKNTILGPGLYGSAINTLVNSASQFLTGLAGVSPEVVKTAKFKRYLKSNISQDQIGTLVGNVFEGGVLAALNIVPTTRTRTLDLTRDELAIMGKTFKIPGLSKYMGGDFKNSLSKNNRDSMADKIISSSMVKAHGFIPNFSPLDKALKTENMMGGKGVLDYKEGLGLYVRDGKTQPNFAAVMRDHPEGIQKAIKNSKLIQSATASAGFTPNFLPFVGKVFGSEGIATKAFGSKFLTPNVKSLQTGGIDTSGIQKAIDILTKKFDQGNISVESFTKSLSKQAKTAGVSGDNLKKFETQTSNILNARAGAKGVGLFGSINTRFENTGFGRFSKGVESKALLASIGAPIVAESVKNIFGQESGAARTAGAVVSGIGDVASFAATGSLFGPLGTAVGLGAGTISAVFKIFGALNDRTADLTKTFDNARDKLSNMTATVQSINVAAETLDKFEAGDFGGIQDPTIKAKLRIKAENELNDNLAKLDKSTRDQFLQARKEGRREDARYILNEAVVSVQKETERAQIALDLYKLEQNKVLKRAGQEGIAGAAAKTEIRNIAEPLFQGLNLEQLQSLRGATSQDMFANLLQQNLGVDPEVAKNLALYLPYLQTILTELIKVKESAAKIASERKEPGPKDLTTFQAYQQELKAQFSRGSSMLGPNTTINYGALYENQASARSEQYATSITQNLQKIAQEFNDAGKATTLMREYINQINEINQKEVKGIISASEAQALREERFSVMLEKETRPRMFSDQYASSVQKELESYLKQGNIEKGLQPAAMFFANLGDNAQTTARKINESFANLANNLEAGFEDAFDAFISGTKSAEDAFRDMLLSLSQQIIKEQFSIGLRGLLGGLTGGGGVSAGGGGLFGGIFNSLFGGGAGGKAKGGIIKKYSGGGYVDGGSGVRDDVPALLTDGEYVLRKSAVNKYGLNTLNMLNRGGKIRGYATGGSISMGLANTFDIFDPEGRLVTQPIGQYALERTISSPEELANIPEYAGKYNISNLLSSYAISREDNPMNALRDETARTFQGYQQNVSGFKTNYNEAMRQVEEQRRLAQQQADEINSQAMAQYNAGLRNTFIGGLFSAGLGIANATGALGKFTGLITGGLEKAFGVAQGAGAFGGVSGGGGAAAAAIQAAQKAQQEEQMQKYIEGALKSQVSIGGLGGFPLMGPGMGGGFGGGANPYNIPYYGAGAGLNVGLGGSYAGPAGMSTFTQSQASLNNYLVQPAGVIPPTGLTLQRQIQTGGVSFGAPVSAGGVSFGRGFAKGGKVRGYNTGRIVAQFGEQLKGRMIGGQMQFIDPDGKVIFSTPIRSGAGNLYPTPEGNYKVGNFRSRNDLGFAKAGVGYSANIGADTSQYNLSELINIPADLRPQNKGVSISQTEWARMVKSGDFYYDKNAQRYRSELRIHADGGLPGTAGCIGAYCNSPVEQQKVKDLLASGNFSALEVRYGQALQDQLIASRPEPQNVRIKPAEQRTMLAGGIPAKKDIFPLTAYQGRTNAPVGTNIVTSARLPVPFTNRAVAPAVTPNAPQGPGIFSRVGDALKGGYGKVYDTMYNLGFQLDPFSKDGVDLFRAIGRGSTLSEQAIKNLGAKIPPIGSAGAGGIGGAVMSSLGGLGNLAKTGYGKVYDTMYNLGARAYETSIFNPNRVSYADKMTFPITENPMTRTPAEISKSLKDILSTSQTTAQQAFIGPQLPTDLYTTVGAGIASRDKALSKYSSFYGSLGSANFYRYGSQYQNFANQGNLGQLGFQNYMQYLGFGGNQYGIGMPFGGFTTPGTLSPYAFSSQYFGGFSPFGIGSSGFGFGGTGVPFSTYFSTGSRLGITPSWASRATGGMIYGGSSYKDDVPAMLMGGEYVIKKDIVDRMGEPFFNRLNRGQIQGFAEGGPVGTNLPSLGQNLDPNNPQQNTSQAQMTEALTKLLKSLEQLNRSIDDQTKEIQDQNDQQGNEGMAVSEGGVTNNISINVNVAQDGQETNSTTNADTENSGKDGASDQEKLKKTLEKSRMFAELLRQQVLKTIVEEQRPGGVLYQGSKGRDMGR